MTADLLSVIMSDEEHSQEEAYERLANGEHVDDPALVSDSDELQAVLDANDVVVVDFYADWCGPCQMMDSVLETLAGEPAPIVKVDVDASEKLTSSYEVRSLPTYIIFVDGQPEEELTGIQEEDEFRDTISEHVA